MPHSMSVPLFNYADSNFIVHHTVSENFEDPYTRLHMHTMYELYCFLDGEGVFTVEGNIYKLESGMLLLIRPGEAHPFPQGGLYRTCPAFSNFYPEYFLRFPKED